MQRTTWRCTNLTCDCKDRCKREEEQTENQRTMLECEASWHKAAFAWRAETAWFR